MGASEEDLASMTREVEVLEDALSIPFLKAGWLVPDPSGGAALTLQYAQRYLPGNTQRRSLLGTTLSEAWLELGGTPPGTPAQELRDALAYWPSPSGQSRVVVRAGGDGASKGSTLLEIWGLLRLEQVLAVPEELHGAICADTLFGGGGPGWSADETKLVYVAEAPPSPKGPAWGSRASKEGEGKARAAPEAWHGRSPALEDWGERYTGQRPPRLFVLNLESRSVDAVRGLDSATCSVGQPVWTPKGDGIVFVAWSHVSTNFPGLPQRLGALYCFNRPCHLAAVAWPQEAEAEGAPALPPPAVVTHLTPDTPSAFSPRFSPDGRSLVFLSQAAAVKSGVHAATAALCALRWAGLAAARASLPVVRELVEVRDAVSDATDFPGLYPTGLLGTQAWATPDTLLLTTQWRFATAILAVSLATGVVRRVSPPPGDEVASWSLVAAERGWVVAARSSQRTPGELFVCHGTSGDEIAAGAWTALGLAALEGGAIPSLLAAPLRTLRTTLLTDSRDKMWEAALLARPRESRNNPQVPHDIPPAPPRPLLLMPHGGPHAAFTTEFSPVLAALGLLGYDMLLVNYRGSLGYGEARVQALPGLIGDADVADCLAALAAARSLGRVEPNAPVAVVGGSHGGFLTGHLLGQNPDAFFAGVLRNPVLDLSLMIHVSDIPDWVYVEAWGVSGEARRRAAVKPTAEDLARFYAMSPIAHADKVTAPMLFLLGAKDRRVPLRDSQQYASALRAHGGPATKTLIFPEDSHALDTPQTELDQWINALQWLKEHQPEQTKTGADLD